MNLFFFHRQLNQNNLTGSITVFLASMNLAYLSLANNQLCYWMAYNTWATATDFAHSLACQNCVSPCQNGGTCTVNLISMTCACPPDFLGDTCSVSSSSGCGAGLAYSSSGTCTSCLPGPSRSPESAAFPARLGHLHPRLLLLLPQTALLVPLVSIQILLDRKPAPPAAPTSAPPSAASPPHLHPFQRGLQHDDP